MSQLSERDLYSRFNDTLDEVFETVSIAGYEYSVSQAFKQVDLIAYEEEFKNWLDEEIGDRRFFERDGEYFSERPKEED